MRWSSRTDICASYSAWLRRIIRLGRSDTTRPDLTFPNRGERGAAEASSENQQITLIDCVVGRMVFSSYVGTTLGTANSGSCGFSRSDGGQLNGGDLRIISYVWHILIYGYHLRNIATRADLFGTNGIDAERDLRRYREGEQWKKRFTSMGLHDIR